MLDKSTFDVAKYWEERYASGRSSGSGSYNRLARFKSHFINNFVDKNSIYSVVELGCGDGAQLSLMDYERYLGLDISETTIKNCAEKYKNDPRKVFRHYDPNLFEISKYSSYELGVSLDVIYHLSNDDVYKRYLEHLFGLASKYVIIYSNSQSLYYKGVDESAKYVRFREFHKDIEKDYPEWGLVEVEPNFYPFNASLPDDTSFADFYVFKKDATNEERLTTNTNHIYEYFLKKIIHKQMVNDELNIKLIEKLDTIIHIVNSIEYSEKIELVLEELSRLSLVKGSPVEVPHTSEKNLNILLDSAQPGLGNSEIISLLDFGLEKNK